MHDLFSGCATVECSNHQIQCDASAANAIRRPASATEARAQTFRNGPLAKSQPETSALCVSKTVLKTDSRPFAVSGNISGLNTAATLWCTAAVGTLAGLGHLGFAAMGAVGVLSANLILRPVANLINRAPVHKDQHEILYRLGCTLMK